MADNMQNDAMERFRQMYSKAQPQNVTHSNVEKNKTSSQNVMHSKEEENKSPHIREIKPENAPIHKNKSENLLDFFMRDKEKSLILLLIVILMSEKADTTLILALMYLVI